MADSEVHELFERMAALDQVEAIALGGSRAGEEYDEKSDYDVYLYCTGEIGEEKRRAILSGYCGRMEIGNRFWEYEDNCTLRSGVDIDLLYRDLDGFVKDVASVVEGCQARNGYTTCMWHNLRTCRVIYDRDGRLAAARERFEVPYPRLLKERIVERGWRLLRGAMPAYEGQIAKALGRGDLVSVNHRVSAFLETYFDVLFALNEQTHPGEKRLVRLCRQRCALLPDRFEENIQRLFSDLFTRSEAVMDDIGAILDELKKIL